MSDLCERLRAKRTGINKQFSDEDCHEVADEIERLLSDNADAEQQIEKLNEKAVELLRVREQLEQMQFGIAAVAFALGWTDLKGVSLEQFARDTRNRLVHATDALREAFAQSRHSHEAWAKVHEAFRALTDEEGNSK